jgi:hypothetical protein
MTLTRDRIAVAIRAILADGEPRGATELTALVKQHKGLDDVRAEDLVATLSEELAEEAISDEGCRWTLRPKLAVNESMSAMDRAVLLRAIHRLRSGLPPSESVIELTVGAEKVLPTIEGWLDGTARSRRTLFVQGNYGEGKSHSLALLRERAHQAGFATCQLTADASSSALNHPQRFLPLLLATLELPSASITSFEQLLYRLLMDDEMVHTVAAVVDHYLQSNRTLDAHCRSALATLVGYRGSGPDRLDERLLWIRVATIFLSGDFIRHRSATPDNRTASYKLLTIASELMCASGARGLVILVDEVESVYTKLPTVRSREGAYRVLSALCASPDLSSLRVALAITPDAWRHFRRDIDTFGSIDALPCEPVASWGRALSTTSSSISLQPLEAKDRRELVRRVSALYSRMYVPPVRPVDRVVDQMISREVPVRILVRQAVDHLDIERYRVRP